jgi:hypothetical protein
VMTSATISARFSTGPGEVGAVEIHDRPGHWLAHVLPVTESGQLVTHADPTPVCNGSQPSAT